jgi:hypothetical protein
MSELLNTRPAEFRPGDLVLLSDGDRVVAEMTGPSLGSDGRRRVAIEWEDGETSVWLADEPCEVVRR